MMGTKPRKQRVRSLLTTGQIARAVDMSQQTIIRRCKDGSLQCVWIGAHRRVYTDVARAWAEKNGYRWVT